MSVNVADGSERVVVRWCQAQGDPRAAARAVAGLLLGQLQPSAERASAYLPVSAREDWRTRQSTGPLSFQVAAQRVAAIQWDGSMTSFTRALLDDGSHLEAKNPRGKRQAPQGALVNEERPMRRKPAVVNRRPGEGGLKRRPQGDPTAGLAEYGEVVWLPASGGAKLGVLDLSPTGNAVAVCRLSGRDKNENLVDQLRPLLALEKANPETLRYRRALMSVDMSGGRDVRPEDALFVNADQAQRDDATLLDSWYREGWLQHIAFRDPDRMAREILPAEVLYRRWRTQGIQVWFADIGRPIAWDSDRLLLRIRQLIATEERYVINRRLQTAAINKGPLAGRGWPGPTRFGFTRDPQSKELRPDPAQWPFILRAFELADSAAFRNQGGLSTREISNQLAAEGCTLDHDRIRTILGDAIYATGEFVTRTRGIPIAQRPIPLPEPVPLDRFQRVQGMLSLRQGSCSRDVTP